MSDALKKPLFHSLGEYVGNRYRTLDDLRGKCLPCIVKAVDGATVTVDFEVDAGLVLPTVTMPVAVSEYLRVPVFVGDKGVAVPASMSIAGITGLGGGLSKQVDVGNLGALFFVPLGNAAWATVNATAIVLSAPGGTMIRSQDGTVTLAVSSVGIVGTAGANVLTISAAGITALTAGATIAMGPTGMALTGVLTINGSPYPPP